MNDVSVDVSECCGGYHFVLPRVMNLEHVGPPQPPGSLGEQESLIDFRSIPAPSIQTLTIRGQHLDLHRALIYGAKFFYTHLTSFHFYQKNSFTWTALSIRNGKREKFSEVLAKYCQGRVESRDALRFPVGESPINKSADVMGTGAGLRRGTLLTHSGQQYRIANHDSALR